MSLVYQLVCTAALATSACGRVDFDAREVVDATPSGRTCSPWSAPRHLARASTVGVEFAPAFDASGLALVYTSNVTGDYDLYVARRATLADEFSAGVRLAVSLVGVDEVGPTFEPTTGALHWFTTTNQQGRLGADNTVTDVTDVMLPGFHPWFTQDGRGVFVTVYDVDDANLLHATRASETAPWVVDNLVAGLVRVGLGEGWATLDEVDGLLYFERDIAARPGTSELAVAAPPYDPASVSVIATAPSRTSDPSLSTDGTELVFSADFPGGLGSTDLYELRRTCTD